MLCDVAVSLEAAGEETAAGAAGDWARTGLTEKLRLRSAQIGFIAL